MAALSLADALAQAFRLVDRGNAAEARKVARRIEKQSPVLPGLAYLLGLIAFAEQEDAKAARHFAKALEESPDATAPLLAMARTQARQGRDEAAESHYRRLLGRADAPAAAPELAALLLKRGIAARDMDAFQDACVLFAEAAQLDPQSVLAQTLLGHGAEAAGERDIAISAHRRVLALDPEDRYGAAVSLAKLGAGAVPAKSSDAFVRGLFDQYAAKFDAELVVMLRYRAPELLLDAIKRMLGMGPFDTYDAGCGTGLMGALLRPLARRLVGSDLSPNMVEQAKKRRIYDALAVGDFVLELGAAADTYDLVTAADVFVYIGDLDPAFRAVARALRPGGGFAFSVEHLDQGDWGVVESGRFAHSKAYLRKLAETHGFETLLIEDVSTRDDRSKPVPGLVCVMRKTG